MKFIYFILIIAVSLIGFVYAQNAYEDCEIYGNCPPDQVSITFNNNTGAVNSSDFWDALDTPVAIADDNLYHVKIEWINAANDTFKIYMGGIEKSNDQCVANQTSGVNMVRIRSYGDSTAYLYFDAPGLVGETDPKGIIYEEGGNINIT